MSDLNYHVLNDSVILNYDGKTFNINSADNRYARIIECIKSGDLDRIPEIVEIERALTAKGLIVIDGLVHIDGVPMPDALSKRVLAFHEQGLPFDYLLKFWDNLRQNVSYNARQMLYNFLNHNGHPITKDGCFIAYRGVSDQFKDRHTGKFDNSPGKVCKMPRNAVDDNPNNICSAGLHVACYDYAYGWGPKRIEVKINPKDVVCVPADYEGTKMRVCKFEVVRECYKMYDSELYDDEPKKESLQQLKQHATVKEIDSWWLWFSNLVKS